MAATRKQMMKFVEKLGFDPKQVFEVTLTPEFATVTSFRDFSQRAKGGFDIKDIPWAEGYPKALKVGDVVQAKDIAHWQKKLGVTNEVEATNKHGYKRVLPVDWREQWAPYTVTKVPAPKFEFKLGEVVRTQADIDAWRKQFPKVEDQKTIMGKNKFGHFHHLIDWYATVLPYTVTTTPTFKVGDTVKSGDFKFLPVGTKVTPFWVEITRDGWAGCSYPGDPWVEQTDSTLSGIRTITFLPSKFEVGQFVSTKAEYEALPVGAQVYYNYNGADKWYTKKPDGDWLNAGSTTYTSDWLGNAGWTINHSRKIKFLP
ncbi:MAG: hypothetical protein WC322_02925 [Candidatus Paceibacterota bacterium]|jgi:hypothetical protein